MIGLIASIVGGLILKEYVLLGAIPVFLVSIKNRDMGLVAYFLYIIYVSSKVLSVDVYVYEELITALVFAISGVLLLEDVLKREVRIREVEIIPLLFILFGFLLPESFIAGGIIYFLNLRPHWKAGVPIVGAVMLLLLTRRYVEGLGASAQVALFGGFTVFTLVATFLTKEVKKVEMFEK